MTSNKNLSILNQLRPVTIGFDPMFDRFEALLNDEFFMNSSNSNYPPYNINKTGEYTYDIEVALAGFSKADIDVEYKDSVITIKSIHQTKAEDTDDGVLYRGISKRHFTKSFTISDDVEVKGAELKDGLLRISLERIIPESKKARTIEVK
jgi:molecular chaperone IbpA|tara:strand:- start:6127 stop:6576 length:450 start_codon:yes stop_codon:yes gene_type:complete